MCLPSHDTGTSRANAMSFIHTKSQLEVCGAAINTHCAASGALPSNLQPHRLSTCCARNFLILMSNRHPYRLGQNRAAKSAIVCGCLSLENTLTLTLIVLVNSRHIRIDHFRSVICNKAWFSQHCLVDTKYRPDSKGLSHTHYLKLVDLIIRYRIIETDVFRFRRAKSDLCYRGR